MSNDEKNCQIGDAVIAYSKAKVELAHSESALRSIADTYRRAAEVLANRQGENFTSADEALKAITEPYGALVGAERLRELLGEHQQKKTALADTFAQIKRFGLNVE